MGVECNIFGICNRAVQGSSAIHSASSCHFNDRKKRINKYKVQTCLPRYAEGSHCKLYDPKIQRRWNQGACGHLAHSSSVTDCMDLQSLDILYRCRRIGTLEVLGRDLPGPFYPYKAQASYRPKAGNRRWMAQVEHTNVIAWHTSPGRPEPLISGLTLLLETRSLRLPGRSGIPGSKQGNGSSASRQVRHLFLVKLAGQGGSQRLGPD
eukprot:1157762-Pelagomonas_calceolata.AAC.4